MTSISCPGCAGVLSAVPREAGYGDYRCQVGHAYAVVDLLLAKEEQIEYALWSAIALLDHLEMIISQVLEAGGPSAPAPPERASLEQRVATAREQQREIRALIQRTRWPEIWERLPGTSETS